MFIVLAFHLVSVKHSLCFSFVHHKPSMCSANFCCFKILYHPVQDFPSVSALHLHHVFWELSILREGSALGPQIHIILPVVLNKLHIHQWVCSFFEMQKKPKTKQIFHIRHVRRKKCFRNLFKILSGSFFIFCCNSWQWICNLLSVASHYIATINSLALVSFNFACKLMTITVFSNSFQFSTMSSFCDIAAGVGI